jgi:Protein of unknown function (DUF2510)
MSEPRADTHPADWYPDPGGRYDLRYFNGTSWTADVSTSGQRYVDPVIGAPGGDGGPTRRNGRAIAALVLGIVGLLTAWMPFFFVVGAVASVLAVVFATVALRRMDAAGSGRGPAVAGLVTGGIGCVAAIGGFFFTVALSNAIDAYENPGPHEVAITNCVETGPSIWSAEGTITNLDDEPHDYVIDVRFARSGTDNAQRTARVEVESLEPGTSTTFEVQRSTAIDDISCSIADVHGPMPFGIDFD